MFKKPGVGCVVATGVGVWWYQEEQRRQPILHEEDSVTIQPGSFQMGSSDDDVKAKEADVDEKLHKLSIVKPVKLSRYEVAQLPVINVSWEDATAYAALLG